jgi:hypothetical protein
VKDKVMKGMKKNETERRKERKRETEQTAGRMIKI